MLNLNNGKAYILKYKYGDKSVFDSYDKCFKLVEEYPIVYTAIPDEFKDKNMAIAFIRANARYLNKYKSMLKFEQEDDKIKSQQGIYVSRDKGRFVHLKNNAVIDTLVDFGILTKDKDVMSEAIKMDFTDGFDYRSLGLFVLDGNTYDEKAVKEGIKIEPALVIRAYEYWKENIEKYPNVIETIKSKNQLYNSPENYELAFYKCLDLVGDNELAIEYLYTIGCKEFDISVNYDHVDKMKKLFSSIPNNVQNRLANHFYFYIKYMKKSAIDERIVRDMVHICPIAGDILPDEAVLKYGLKQLDTDDLVISTCKNCGKCQFQFVRLK